MACAVMLVLLPVIVVILVVGAILQPSTATACQEGAPAAQGPGSGIGDESPLILGEATLSADQIRAWWEGSSYSSGTTVGPEGASMTVVIDAYIREGELEGVRGDWAFAQAVLETGGFTNSDARLRNNFAGIAHYDGQAAGRRFATVAEGVRAHIQLLKKFAAGNDVELAGPDVAPRAGATAESWAALTGTWASAENYWEVLSGVFKSMGGEIVPEVCDGDGGAIIETPDGPVSLVEVDGIGPVNSSIAEPLRRMLSAAARDGVVLTGHSYRSYERQVELRKAHCGTSYFAIYEMSSSSCRPPTARPGRSQHELGLAIDFQNCSSRGTACYRWLARNAAGFGFYNLPSEPWHWSTTGN